MVQHTFEGDGIKAIRQPQLDFISNVLKERGVNGPDVTLEPVGKVGDNYSAEVKRVVVLDDDKTFKMIAKLAPESPVMRKMGNMEMIFSNENLIYSQILPKFRELQKNAGVPKQEWFRFAECYGFSSEAPNEVLLLEDLNEDSYVMLDRFKPMPDDCVKIVLKNLAIFHSLSYVLKHQDPKTFSAFASQVHDIFAGPVEERAEFVIQFEKVELELITLLSDEKYVKAMRGSARNIMNTDEVTKADVGSKYSVIIQGDSWSNNILFKFEHGIPVNCSLIDYQLAREASPAYDIMYMLFNSTTYEQRKKSYYDFIDYYHNEMDKFLNKYGLRTSDVYSRDKLDADLRRYGKLMLSWCITISGLIIRKEDEAVLFQEAMRNNLEAMGRLMSFKDQDQGLLYRSKVEGLIDSFIEFGLMQNV